MQMESVARRGALTNEGRWTRVLCRTRRPHTLVVEVMDLLVGVSLTPERSVFDHKSGGEHSPPQPTIYSECGEYQVVKMVSQSRSRVELVRSSGGAPALAWRTQDVPTRARIEDPGMDVAGLA